MSEKFVKCKSKKRRTNLAPSRTSRNVKEFCRKRPNMTEVICSVSASPRP